MSGPKVHAYNDAHARALVLRFRAALAPVLAQVAPNHLLHHIELVRDAEGYGSDETVQIRLVIKPIGSARVMDNEADLATGPRRIESYP